MMSLIVGLLLGAIVGAVVALMYSAMTGARRARDIRRDAVSQSRAVTRGQVFEQFAAYFPGLRVQSEGRAVPREAGGLRRL